jgi:hypothetical protein
VLALKSFAWKPTVGTAVHAAGSFSLSGETDLATCGASGASEALRMVPMLILSWWQHHKLLPSKTSSSQFHSTKIQHYRNTGNSAKVLEALSLQISPKSFQTPSGFFYSICNKYSV